MSHQTSLSRYFTVSFGSRAPRQRVVMPEPLPAQTPLTRFIFYIPAAPRWDVKRTPMLPRPRKLEQSVLSQYFPNPWMYIGEIGTTNRLDKLRLGLLTTRHVHRGLPGNDTRPLPFPELADDPRVRAHQIRENTRAVVRRAASRAAAFTRFWGDEVQEQEHMDACREIDGYLERHNENALIGFRATLGPRALEYVSTHATSNGDLTLIPLTDNAVAQGPGLQGYLDAVDEDNEDTFDNTAASDLSGDDLPFDSYPDYSTVGTTMDTPSSVDSVPPLLDVESNDGEGLVLQAGDLPSVGSATHSEHGDFTLDMNWVFRGRNLGLVMDGERSEHDERADRQQLIQRWLRTLGAAGDV
ncbi:hypothetical protein B0H11DRAFT_2260739 [Mycena galericulata]|nr:hypothetical protein B0H11DRAFT_2260739 [Mycena galericulata]